MLCRLYLKPLQLPEVRRCSEKLKHVFFQRVAQSVLRGLVFRSGNLPMEFDDARKRKEICAL